MAQICSLVGVLDDHSTAGQVARELERNAFERRQIQRRDDFASRPSLRPSRGPHHAG